MSGTSKIEHVWLDSSFNSISYTTEENDLKENNNIIICCNGYKKFIRTVPNKNSNIVLP